MQHYPDVYTMITGASAGLGKEIALECARRGMNLILVALPGRNLQRLAHQLEMEFGIAVVVYETDLTQPGAVEALAAEVSACYPVNWLVNNAGMGGTAAFLQTTPTFIDQVIQLNVRATALLTRLMLPELLRHPHSYILNVSSVAAFSPMAYKTVYPATKAFVYAFSRGLREELKNTAVSVSIVHPGPILTNFNTSRRIMAQGAFAKIGLLPASEIARIAIKETLNGREMIIPGIGNYVQAALMRMIPETLRIRLLSNVFKREMTAA